MGLETLKTVVFLLAIIFSIGLLEDFVENIIIFSKKKHGDIESLKTLGGEELMSSMLILTCAALWTVLYFLS